MQEHSKEFMFALNILKLTRTYTNYSSKWFFMNKRWKDRRRIKMIRLLKEATMLAENESEWRNLAEVTNMIKSGGLTSSITKLFKEDESIPQERKDKFYESLGKYCASSLSYKKKHDPFVKRGFEVLNHI